MKIILFSAIRNLFETMDRQSGSFPPILMLQVLHGCYPQFAERAEGGQGFQQQVLNYRHFSIPVNPLQAVLKISAFPCQQNKAVFTHSLFQPVIRTV